MAEDLGKLTPLLHGSPQPAATVVDRSSDPREPEAVAADTELKQRGGIVPPTPIVQGLPDRHAASEAAMADADAAAAEMDRGLAQLGRAEVQHGMAAETGAGVRQAPPGAPLAQVAEKPNPGTGSSRVGAARGTSALVDPQTEAELAASGLPGA
ncbi:alpha-mannosidase [Chlorella sorokiniana]|uniref:Alpha-mannosidase n=1 Tax=Chlorella sorokiniana TaxID=3076 RepID=A0A2P6TBK3_CHLSO|nr:alpha-mannosidase [Chlorella sorokiniana]|eukprot:PRW05933.1 alpha-mannosidase [Chlorella sorokiniana]